MNVLPPQDSVTSSEWQRLRLSIPSQLGCDDTPPQSLLYSSSRLPIHGFDHYFKLAKLLGNDP